MDASILAPASTRTSIASVLLKARQNDVLCFGPRRQRRPPPLAPFCSRNVYRRFLVIAAPNADFRTTSTKRARAALTPPKSAATQRRGHSLLSISSLSAPLSKGSCTISVLLSRAARWREVWPYIRGVFGVNRYFRFGQIVHHLSLAGRPEQLHPVHHPRSLLPPPPASTTAPSHAVVGSTLKWAFQPRLPNHVEHLAPSLPEALLIYCTPVGLASVMSSGEKNRVLAVGRQIHRRWRDGVLVAPEL